MLKDEFVDSKVYFSIQEDPTISGTYSSLHQIDKTVTLTGTPIPAGEPFPTYGIDVFQKTTNDFIVCYVYKNSFVVHYTMAAGTFTVNNSYESQAIDTDTTSFFIYSKINISALHGPDSIYTLNVGRSGGLGLEIYHLETIADVSGVEERYSEDIGSKIDYTRPP